MKYLASGKMANVVFWLTFVVGSAIGLLLFNQGVSSYRTQELNHAQQHLQQFVARYDVALQQTVERSNKLADAVHLNSPLKTAQLSQFIHLVYPKANDVAEIYLFSNNAALPRFHYSPDTGLSQLVDELAPYIQPYLKAAGKLGTTQISPIINAHNSAVKAPIIVVVNPIAEEETAQTAATFLITVHQVASLTGALPKEAGRENFAYILADHEQNYYVFPDNKMFDSTPSIDAKRTDIPDLNVPLNILGNQWQLWVYPPTQHVKPIDFIYYVYLTLSIVGSFMAGFLLRYALQQHRGLYLHLLRQSREVKRVTHSLKDTEIALAASEKTAAWAVSGRTQFMNTLSHQIRTPVNGILGMTDLCMQTELSLKQQDYLRKITASAEHLNSVLGDLSDFALLESGELQLAEQPFSLHEIVDSLYAMLSKEAQDKGLVFNITLPHTVHCDLIGDRRRLSEIMLNLCANAIEQTSSGHIHLVISTDNQQTDQDSLTHESDYTLNIMVTDTGAGISQEDINQLFSQGQPLKQNHNAGGRLGLTISQQLCQLMGGEIVVSSQLGIGSCFTASVKLKLNNLIITSPEEVMQLSTPQRIVVIDDNPISLTMLEHALTTMGAEVATFQFASDALEALIENEQPDIILLDWVMPQIGGLAFLSRLQQSKVQITSRILVLTAYDAKSISRMTQQFAVERILSKPCRNEELFHIIEKTKMIASDEDESPLDGLTVLVAEDNMINQEIISELLQQEGAEVLLSNDGQHCIDELKRAEKVDIVLMDINMPVMNGLAALKVIRGELGMADLPIVALTANIFEQDKQQYIHAGMNEHLGKPYDRDQIVQCILRLTQKA